MNIKLTKNNTVDILKKMFFIVFIVIFAFLFFGTLFNLVGDVVVYQKYGDGTVEAITKRMAVPFVRSIISSVCFFALFAMIYKYISKNIEYIEKNEKFCITLITVFVFVFYLIASWIFESKGMGEVRIVMDAADILAKEGYLLNTDGQDYHHYFTVFALIRNVLIYLVLLAKVAFALGLASVKSLAILINCIMMALTVPMLYYIVKKNFGTKEAIMAVLLVIACLPVALFTHVVYNFVLIYPIIVFTLFVYTLLQHSKRNNKYIILLLSVLCGFAIAAGSQLNIAAAIILVAINIQAFMYDNKRAILAIDIVFIVSYMALSHFSAGFADKYIYNEQYNEENGMPALSWFYTGLNEDTVGMFTGETSDFLYDYETKTEREIILKQKIEDNLKQKGLFGYIKHVYKKLIVDFGTGDWGTNRAFWYNNKHYLYRPSIFTQFVTLDGQYIHIYKIITQGYHIMSMFMVLIGAAVMMKKSKTFISPWVSLFGLMLACGINETNPNHAFSYVAIFYICAAVGMVTLLDYIFKKTEEIKNER